MGLRAEKRMAPESTSAEPDPSDRKATALYVGKMAGELRGLALKADLPFLAYLLAMAEEDALSFSPPR